MDNLQMMSFPVYETSESNSPDISDHHHDRSPVSVLPHNIDDRAMASVHDHCMVEKAAVTHDRQIRNLAPLSIVRKQGIAMASEHRHSQLYLHNQPSPSPCAAVPFRWEESPGKPRIMHTTNTEAIASPAEGDSVSVLKLPPKLQSIQARRSISDKLDLRSQDIYRETAPSGSSTMQKQKRIPRLCRSMFTAHQQNHNPDTSMSITAHGGAHSQGARTVEDRNRYHRFFFDKRSASALISDILLPDEDGEGDELLGNRSEWMDMEEKIAIIERENEEEGLDGSHWSSTTWKPRMLDDDDDDGGRQKTRRRARAGAGKGWGGRRRGRGRSDQMIGYMGGRDDGHSMSRVPWLGRKEEEEEESGNLVSKVCSWQQDDDYYESILGAGEEKGLPWLQLSLDPSSKPPPSPSYHENPPSPHLIHRPFHSYSSSIPIFPSIRRHSSSSSSSSPSRFSPFAPLSQPTTDFAMDLHPSPSHLIPSSHAFSHLDNVSDYHPRSPLLHSNAPSSPWILGLSPQLEGSYEPLFWRKFHGSKSNRTPVIGSLLTITSLKNIMRKLLGKKSTRANFMQAHDNMWSPALATYLFNQQQRESELSSSNLGLNLALPSEEVELEHSSSSNGHRNSKCHSNPKQNASDTFNSRKTLLPLPPLKRETTMLNFDHVHVKICMDDNAKNDNRQRIRLKFHEHLAWKDMKKDLAARDVVVMAQ